MPTTSPVANLPVHAVLPGGLQARRRLSPYVTEHLASTLSQRELLYWELQPLLSQLIARYGSDPEMRQELPGEFFCRFHALHQSYDPSRGVPLRPYMVRCLTLGIYTWARSHWRRKRREVILKSRNDFADDASADPASRMQSAMQREELMTSLHAAVESLSPRQREALTARYYGGRSFDEIALTMGVRPATVRSLIRYAIQNLRFQLAEQESQES